MARKDNPAIGEGPDNPTKPLRNPTAKQQVYIDARTAGRSPEEAYRAAYNTSRMKPETVRVEAHRLEHNPNIAPRLRVIQEKKTEALVEAHTLSRELIIGGLISNFQAAALANDYKASNRALELLGKVDDIGLFIERSSSDSRNTVNIESVSRFDGLLEGAERGRSTRDPERVA